MRFLSFPSIFLLSLGLAISSPQAAVAQRSAGHAKPTRSPEPAARPLQPGTPAITTSDGVKLYVRVAGQGPPCVFVHGGPGSGSQAVEVLAGKELEAHFQMIYLDQRGSGRSASASPQDYTLARVVQDLEELRQQLHLSSWVVMAHSFGGTIATAYARQYPARVQGLVLLNCILNLPAAMESTVAYGYPLLPQATRPPLDPAAPLPQRYGMVMGLLNQQKLMDKLMYANDSTARRVERAMQQAARPNRDFATSVTQSAAIADYAQDFTPATTTLPMPVLVVTGRDDYITGPDHYKAFRFPHQQVLVLPGKHFTFLENPQAFNQALAAYTRQLAARK